MKTGSLGIILHAHLPYVRHPEYPSFFEERWLFEAITETYLPILRMLERLHQDAVPCRLTISLSPPLLSMFEDELLQNRYLAYLQNLLDLADKEVWRTRRDKDFHSLALFYRQFYQTAWREYSQVHNYNLVKSFAKYQELGLVDLITCAATHGYLPLLRLEPAAVWAQVAIGVEKYTESFGRRPLGIWLPECGYYPGVEEILAEFGLRFFVVESHGLLQATPCPSYRVMAPLLCANGVAAFARDPESSKQVWSADEGYPGDFDYRDFYRDIGHDLDFEYVKPHILDGQTRIATGFKYYRVTGRDVPKEPYRVAAAQAKASLHANHFYTLKKAQVAKFAATMADPPAFITAPYDAELFGHWWFEGPLWLEHLIRDFAGTSDANVRLATPADYLDSATPALAVGTPAASSWGWKGYSEFWLNGDNQHVYPQVLDASRRLMRLIKNEQTRGHGSPPPWRSRALNQACRNVLLAQASDWPFLMKARTSSEYAEKRLRDHLARFCYLEDALLKGGIDEGYLTALETLDNIFPNLDYRQFGV